MITLMTYISSDSKIILSIKMAKFPMNSDLRNPLEGLGEKFLEPTKLYSLVTCPLAGIPSLCCFDPSVWEEWCHTPCL